MTEQPKVPESPVETPPVDSHPVKASDVITQSTSRDGKTSEFVGADAAKYWFFKQFPPPRGGIETIMLQPAPDTLFKAIVRVDGVIVGTGHAHPVGERNVMEKVESAAVRRALANAGFTKRRAMIELAGALVDGGMAKRLGSGGQGNGRRVGGNNRLDDAYKMVETVVNARQHFDHIVGKLQEAGTITQNTTAQQIAGMVSQHVMASKAEGRNKKKQDAPETPESPTAWLKDKRVVDDFVKNCLQLGLEGLPDILTALDNAGDGGDLLTDIHQWKYSKRRAWAAAVAYASGYDWSYVMPMLKAKGMMELHEETAAECHSIIEFYNLIPQ